ncbi:MAG: glycosyltransferase family 9 protein [Fluviibacter phosphoraccumulans]
MPPEVKRVLAIHVARIGDTLLTTAALRHLSHVYLGAQIDFMGHAKRIEVLEGLPYIHKLASISKKSAKLKGWCAKFMGRKPYDLAFVWGHDAELVAYARRVSKRVVISRQLNEAANLMADQVVEFPNDTNLLSEAEDKPLVQWILDVVEQGTQTKAENLYADYVVTAAESAEAKALLAQYTDNAQPQYIGLVVESHPAGAHRDWPIENFVALAQQLASEGADRVFVLIGGSLSDAKVAALHHVLGDRLINLSGKLSLRQSAAVINALDLYVAVDTGPSHIAAAVGTPSVVMFHCMRAGEYLLAPRYPERLTIVNHPTARVACTFETPMHAVSVERVLAAARAQLAGGKP